MFLYFPDGNWPPCWIFNTVKFYMMTWLGGSRHSTMPIFFQNWSVQSRDITIFWFSKWLPPPSFKIFFRFFKMAAVVILECRIYQILLAYISRWDKTYHITKFSRNSSFHCGDVAFFSNFKHGRCRHLGFLKSQNFISYWGGGGNWGASACQLLSKSVKWLWRY